MTTKVVPGILVATPDAEQAATEAAARMGKIIHEALNQRGRAAIALSGGNTPRAAYTLLGKDARIDWSKVDVFFVDERAVPPEDDRSNYRHAKEALLDPAKVPVDRVHRMPGEAKDLDLAAREYEALLRKRLRATDNVVPTLDLVILGVGDDGHTASLFPGQPEVEITDRLVVAVPARNGLEARLTITAPVIEASRAAMIMAIGASKHAPLERVWEVAGKVSDTPARVARGVRGSVIWIIDRAAGGMG